MVGLVQVEGDSLAVDQHRAQAADRGHLDLVGRPVLEHRPGGGERRGDGRPRRHAAVDSDQGGGEGGHGRPAGEAAGPDRHPSSRRFTGCGSGRMNVSSGGAGYGPVPGRQPAASFWSATPPSAQTWHESRAHGLPPPESDVDQLAAAHRPGPPRGHRLDHHRPEGAGQLLEMGAALRPRRTGPAPRGCSPGSR